MDAAPLPITQADELDPAPAGIPAAAAADERPLRALGVKAVVVLGLAAGMLLSPKLWLSTRSYPLTPVWDGLKPPPSPLDVQWFAALLILLALALVLRRPRVPILLAVGLVLALCLWDQSRFQPWVYQYLFMLAALGLYPWNARGAARGDPARAAADAALDACRLVIVFTYFWSGLQKFNHTFFAEIAPWLLDPIAADLPAALRPRVLSTGPWLMPFAEVAVALGLLFRRSRPAAAAGAVVMHLMILWSIGPFGRDWNTVVWPWNLAMIALVLLLFVRAPRGPGPRRTFWPRRGAPPAGATTIIGWVVLLMLGVMPLASFAGWWDPYLSACLYSGNTPQGDIVVASSAYDRLPPALRSRCDPAGDGWYVVSVFNWSVKELNVPSYPAARVFRRVAGAFRPYAQRTGEVVLVVSERPPILGGKRDATKYDCADDAPGR
jgi:uncharacterized membrane protein YphA (DoxX/SURF4 family)